MGEVLSEGKNFKLLSDTDLPEVLKFLEKFLPDSIKFHQTLQTYLYDRVWTFHFYITKNWPEQAVILHFPGITKTPNDNIYESLGVFCPKDQLDDLDLLMQEDILIDWSKPISINLINSYILDRVEEIYSERGTFAIDLIGEVFGISNAQDTDPIEYLDDSELRPLKPENIEMIYELYPAKHMESKELFEQVLDKLPCYGVFSSSGELAAWMLQSYYGALFSMQTRPEFRRKGYGIIVAKHLTKVAADNGYLPFVVIRPDNEASKGLYKKLGYTKYFDAVRGIMTPYKENGCIDKVSG